MNRIDLLFKNKTQNILSIYFTAGYPKLNDTETIIIELEKAGVDMIEIGFPFSDPLADGPVIQQSSEIALKNGMNLKLLFNQIKNIRQKISIPLVLMGYLNPAMQYGMENLCRDACSTGIDGLILPDLPLEIYLKEYQALFQKYNLHFIPLITPQTSIERIKKIDDSVSGFIYLVSSSSTTGTKGILNENIKKFTDKILELKLRNPRLIGFGINNKESYYNVCRYATGGIIGTAFIRALDRESNISGNVEKFIESIR